MMWLMCIYYTRSTDLVVFVISNENANSIE